MTSDVLIKAEKASKKFSSNLKSSMKYGIIDITKDFIGIHSQSDALRPDEFWSVQDVSFEIHRGECLGLIGPNGAGKSTLLKMLNGIILPDKGHIEINGRVGALIEVGAGFHPILTGRENIYINGSIMGLRKKEIDQKFDSIVEFAELGDFIDMPVSYYSSGMYVRLGFAIAAHLEPDVLLIDEVLAVGDMGFKIKCLNRIGKLMQDSAVIFVSHAMQFVSRICSDVMVLNHSRAEYLSNDVGAGIDYYLSKFESSDLKIYGSSKVTISNIALFNERSKENEGKMLLLNYDDNLSIEMDLTLNCSALKPAIKIIILDQELRSVADCFSKFCGFHLQPIKSSRILVHFRNIPFNAGIYSVTICVLDLSSNDEVLSRYDNAASFQIAHSCRSWSSFLIKGDWEQHER
jgi:lipopolysaccharide transport system ATP-binding protein